MSVYVDNMAAPLGRMKMSHMWADTREELLEMADRIGVDRRWFQRPASVGGPGMDAKWEHFDIAQSRRRLAVQLGAIETDRYGPLLHQARGRGDQAAVDRIHSLRERAPTPEVALSIQQPWAWLIVHGFKPVENRTWSTSRRGRFLIHAGKRVDAAGYKWVRETFPGIPLPTSLEVGGIVGEARLVDCVEAMDSPWFFGPHGFVLADGQPLPFRPLRGHLGFFRVEP